MIQIEVEIITEPLQIDVTLDARIGANLTVINDTIDANGTTIINDPLT